MLYAAFTAAGSSTDANEDWFSAAPDVLTVLDGATSRTETGCTHGAAWYTRHLGARLSLNANYQPSLAVALECSIREVAALHSKCDLSHPGTPSAAVAVARLDGSRLRYLVLGDITVVVETSAGVEVISDHRVSATAAKERREADKYPIGSDEKARALVDMKHAELSAKNHEGGYWIAASSPGVSAHAICGSFAVSDIKRLVIMSDGAARAVDTFTLLDWASVPLFVQDHGPAELVNRVRTVERGDPVAAKYARNKMSDDATVVFAGPEVRQ